VNKLREKAYRALKKKLYEVFYEKLYKWSSTYVLGPVERLFIGSQMDL